MTYVRINKIHYQRLRGVVAYKWNAPAAPLLRI